MTAKSFEILHNIAAPYRVHLFSCLAEALAARGYTLRVHFFGSNNPDRPASWGAALTQARFDYKIWGGVVLNAGGAPLWLNPGLLWQLAFRRPDILLHGGIWDSLTSLLALFTARPRFRAAWLEFNVDIPGRRSRAVAALKRALLARCDRLLVPGAKGVHYLEQFVGSAAARRAIVLPNFVDESVFRAAPSEGESAAARRAIGVDTLDPATLVLLWPARLIEQKGVLEFLRAVDADTLRGAAIRILGEGPLKREIEVEIVRRGLQDHVALGEAYADYRQMPALYHASTALLLPSLIDPNPLSVVEALHAGLPVLLSTRVGNATEALEEGRNGFGFDPADPAQVRRALRSFIDLTAEARAALGRRAAEIAAERWDSHKITERVVAELLTAAANGD